MSWKYKVKKTNAFQGVDPRMPCNRTLLWGHWSATCGGQGAHWFSPTHAALNTACVVACSQLTPTVHEQMVLLGCRVQGSGFRERRTCRMMMRKVGTLHMPHVSRSSSRVLCDCARPGVPDLRCRHASVSRLVP